LIRGDTVKALAYEKAHPLDAFSLELVDVAEPRVRDADLLIEIRAVAINPGETFIRQTRSAEAGGHIILGWEFAGVVVDKGPAVDGFSVGDRVMGTGDATRDGCWAERVAVDHRVAARIPEQLDFVDAASLPIGALTAWEALFRERDSLPSGVERVLVIGGAGGVGSMATQLLKARTQTTVIATASRPASRAWCTSMGADLVVDHTHDVIEQLAAAGVDRVDMVLSTAASAENIGWIAQLLRPYGHISIVDGAPTLDLGALMSKSASLHTEMVFSKVASGGDLGSQGRILAAVASNVAAGRIRPIATTRLDGLTAENMKDAHELLETRRTVGKVVIAT
jgi:NADPH2:quinone reductase